MYAGFFTGITYFDPDNIKLRYDYIKLRDKDGNVVEDPITGKDAVVVRKLPAAAKLDASEEELSLI